MTNERNGLMFQPNSVTLISVTNTDLPIDFEYGHSMWRNMSKLERKKAAKQIKKNDFHSCLPTRQ